MDFCVVSKCCNMLFFINDICLVKLKSIINSIVIAARQAPSRQTQVKHAKHTREILGIVCFPKFRFGFLFVKFDAVWSFSASLTQRSSYASVENSSLGLLFWTFQTRQQSNFENVVMLWTKTVLSVWTMMNQVRKRKPVPVILCHKLYVRFVLTVCWLSRCLLNWPNVTQSSRTSVTLGM